MVTRRLAVPVSSFTDFGTLLRVLRHRVRLTQRELGLAVGYSEAQISRLEQRRRLPDPAVVAALFLPALSLGLEPELAARLHELAVLARAAPRGSEPPPSFRPGQALAAVTAADAADLAAIPATPSHYVERPELIAELREQLEADQRILMCGLPGMGKTSLAAALARRRAAGGPVCWVPLTAGITTPAEAVIRLLARFLCRHGYAETAPLCDPGQLERPLPRDEQLYLITTAITRAGALICLDNVHLLREEPETRRLIEHIAGSTPAAFLAISREDLPLAGFAPFRIGGLARPEARALATALAGPLLPPPLADTLAERTDGSPMLIRLAVGRLHPGGPRAATLIDRLEADPGVAAYLLQATLGDLSEASRRLISMLAVFRHPVDLLDERLIEASEALGGRYDVLAGLDELRRRQLVEHLARADLHPLVRDHIYAGLVGAAAGRKRLHGLAARYCEQVLDDPLEASWHYARAGEAAEAADLIVARADDLTARGRSGRAADLARELLAAGEVTGDTVRQLLVAQGDLLLHTERAGEAEDAYRQALGCPAPAAVRAGVAWRLAQSLLQRGQVQEALDLCRSAAAGLSESEDVLRARLGVVQSRAHLMLSEFGAAAAVAVAACATADAFADIAPEVAAAVRARAYWVLGVTARLRGNPAEAVSWLRRATVAARSAGLREVAGRALFNLGAIAHELGDSGEAEQSYQEALAQLRPIGDGYGIARVLHALGMLRNRAGAQDEAMRLYDEACGMKKRMGDRLGAANSEQARALILLARGQTEAARALLRAILDDTEELGERLARAHYLDSLAMVDLVDGDHQTAQRHLADAAAIAAEVDNPNIAATISVHRGFAALAAGDLTAAARLSDSCAAQMAGAGTGRHAGVTVEHAALTACLALAAGDLAGAGAAAAEMGAQARGIGDVRYGIAAQRISAAIAAAHGRQPAVGPQRPATGLARLLWVDI